MTLSKKALQRKREKKKKKRQAIRGRFTVSTAPSHTQWPVYECLLSTELWEEGIGHVIVARKEEGQNKVAVGVYLLDVFCLGIKNCFTQLTDVDDYEALLDQMVEVCGEFETVEPCCANTLIHQAVAYAKSCGFNPHEDFEVAKKLLRGLPQDEEHVFSFGKEGKPCYMPGPDESNAAIKKKLEILEATKGTGNYDFFVPAF